MILPYTTPEKAFASVTAARAIVLARRSISTNCTYVTVSIAHVSTAQHLQLLHVFHHRRRRCVIFCVCKSTRTKSYFSWVWHVFSWYYFMLVISLFELLMWNSYHFSPLLLFFLHYIFISISFSSFFASRSIMFDVICNERRRIWLKIYCWSRIHNLIQKLNNNAHC